jgi:hypothetical protein
MYNKKTEEFEILPEHLKLVQRFFVQWQDDEFGAPEIDPKRPYGNSDVYQDMVSILGFKQHKDDEERFDFELFKEQYTIRGCDKYNLDFENQSKLTAILDKLHKDLEKVLQIALVTQEFKTGTYKKTDEYNDRSWIKV